MPRQFPLTRGQALAVAVALLAVAVVAGRQLGGSGGRPADARADAPRLGALRAAAAPKLVVHVVGAVRRPGLYRLPHGARISDAVARAGGPTRRAELEAVNLAAPLADGTQVVVPRRLPADAPPTAAAGEGGAAGPVHLNTASVEELDALPGIGPVTAEKIIAYRDKHGAFASVDDLDAVPGIGPARLEQLRELVAP